MDYLEIFEDINYLSYIGSFIKWSLIFLLISIILLIIGNRYKLFRRQKKISNIIAKSYFIFIPIYFLVFALKFAPIKNTQKELNSVIDIHKQEIVDYANIFLVTIDSDSLVNKETSIKETVDNYLKKHVYSDLNKDTGKNSIGKRLFNKIWERIEFNFLRNIIESRFAKESSKVIGIDENTGEKLYKTSLNELFKEGEIVEIFRLEMNNIFSRLYKSFFIIFFIGLLIPISEIILSKIFKY